MKRIQIMTNIKISVEFFQFYFKMTKEISFGLLSARSVRINSVKTFSTDLSSKFNSGLFLFDLLTECTSFLQAQEFPQLLLQNDEVYVFCLFLMMFWSSEKKKHFYRRNCTGMNIGRTDYQSFDKIRDPSDQNGY